MTVETLATVTALVRRRLPDTGATPFDDADAVLADHGLDSLGMVALLVELEEAFAIRLPTELVVPETFATVRTIATAVDSVRGGTP